ncbi:MAG: RNA-binding protein [Thaumarchaeota archaeon]|nr:RNA-binding protein [Nitrososphaerota archaeon]RNJ72302.1 MAG: RNA-binding protein [Thaumarchaeota archaeon S13]RNJ73124.1 MAG: RNA-binding protein [Thaumarchaeota archaeon S14]MDD9808871.1 RNA-binding protein [Nitrososphaerota archaeon]MDD9812793.1 RNA-binding protein [Nitrososphaerota archaeon]
MRVDTISKSDTAALVARVAGQWGGDRAPAARNARVYRLEGALLYDIGGVRVLEAGGALLPFLGQDETLGTFPRVTVDAGAVRFMCNGANLMRPGITGHGEFAAGDIVCIAEATHGKFLAVGRASVASSEIDGMERGEVVRNMHYVSDRHWDAAKAI